MVMGKDSSPPTDNRPSYLSRSRQPINKDEEEEGHRESQSSALSEQNLYGPKERFSGRQNDLGLVNPQLIHKVPILQDVNHERSEVTSPKVLLDDLNRFPRGILACTNKSNKETIPRISLERSKLAIQSHAIRLECCTPDFYKNSSTCYKVDGSRRDMVSTVPRRPTYHSGYQRRMPSENREGFTDSEITRVDYQHRKVTFSSFTGVRMVGCTFRSHQPYSKNTYREVESVTTSSKAGDIGRVLYSERNNATARYGKLGESTRPNSQADATQNKEDHQILQEVEHRHTSETEQSYEAESLQVEFRHSNSTVSRKSTTQYNHTDRCYIRRLGIPDGQKSLLGNIRQDNVLLNKCPRVVDSMVFTFDGRRERGSNPDKMRQLVSNCICQEERIPSPPPFSISGANMEESGRVSMDPIHLPYQRNFQCNSRPTITENRDFHRMVSTTRDVSEDPTLEPQAPGRFICNTPQQSTPNIHLTLPGRESSGDRCTINTMGQVETSVHISPNEPNFEGFSKDDSISTRISNFSDARNSYQAMVHGTSTSGDPLEADRGTSPTDSCGQTGSEATGYETSRVEALKKSYKRKFPNCLEAVDLMATPLRDNSIGDYQRKWEKFIEFLRENKVPPEEVSISDVIRFFVNLFNKDLKPSTVNHYKTALTKPLLAEFSIDIKIQEIKDLIKAMQIARPALPTEEPQWSFNKVLTYINDMPEPLSDRDLLRKAAFLILLSTGWRISELHACVRLDKYCQFSQNSLRLRAHPNFLAKNENVSNRWKARDIKPLILRNGGVSRLCPVSTLRSYLRRSKGKRDGPLFQPVSKGAKPLTKHGLSTEICKLILEADPVAKAKVHDVRKYAASYSLAETMVSPVELSKTIGWSSPATFFKYYMTTTEPLARGVSLPRPGPSDRHR